MAEDTKEPETPEVAEEAAPVVPTVYVLQSTVRSRHNRTQRAAVPGRQPFVHKLAGGRITVRRARPARISEAVLVAHLVEVKAAVARHQIVVTTLDGRPVDLDSFMVGTSAAAASPRPNPPLDSAKNDKNEGVGYNVPGSPEGTTLDSPEPELLKPSSLLTPGEVPGGEEVEEEAELEALLQEGSDPDAEPETTPVPSTSASTPPPAGKPHGHQRKRGRS